MICVDINGKICNLKYRICCDKNIHYIIKYLGGMTNKFDIPKLFLLKFMRPNNMHPIFNELETQLSDWQYANQMNFQENITAEKLLLTAEKTTKEVPLNLQDETIWKNFLAVTRKPQYLMSLTGREERYRWAEVCFAAVQSINYSFYRFIYRQSN